MNLNQVTTTDSPGRSKPLRRVEVREILRRHKGSITAIAEQLDVSPQNVSGYLRGRITSKRVEDAARAKAEQLLQQEASQNAA